MVVIDVPVNGSICPFCLTSENQDSAAIKTADFQNPGGLNSCSETDRSSSSIFQDSSAPDLNTIPSQPACCGAPGNSLKTVEGPEIPDEEEGKLKYDGIQGAYVGNQDLATIKTEDFQNFDRLNSCIETNQSSPTVFEDSTTRNLNTIPFQPACCGAPVNSLKTVGPNIPDEEGKLNYDGIQDKLHGSVSSGDHIGILPVKTDSETNNQFATLPVKVDPSGAPVNLDIQVYSLSKVSGDCNGIATQLSVDYIDIFEIIREEILAAEAREIEVIQNGLLQVGDEGGDEFLSRKDCIETAESTFWNEDRSIDLCKDDSQGGSESNVSRIEAAEAEETTLLLDCSEKSDSGQVAPLESSHLQSFEGSSLGETERISMKNDEVDDRADAAQNILQKEEESGPVKDHLQNAEEVAYDESSTTANMKPKDTITTENEGEGASADEDKVAPEDYDGNGLEHEVIEKLTEPDEDFTSGTFSGPIAFSGMLSYSGVISYSGQIPYSGNLSLHSDSSTSTRSFAFPILASDWNSSPAKIGQPDSRYFRRRRRWRPRFCCKRPATLFD